MITFNTNYTSSSPKAQSDEVNNNIQFTVYDRKTAKHHISTVDVDIVCVL